MGYRFSDYASAGSFDSWKAELIYQPVDAVRVRGSYQQAVRAPSVFELYLPQLPQFDDFFFFPGDSWIRAPPAVRQRNGPDAAQVEALCLAQGVPAALLPDVCGLGRFVSGVVGGNPELGPEEATTTTIGVVWTSRLSHPLLSNLQLSLDWYEIDIADKIDTGAFRRVRAVLLRRRYNPDFSVTNQWCAIFGRDPVTGEIDDVQELNRNGVRLEDERGRRAGRLAIRPGPGQIGVNWLVSWVDSFTIGVRRQQRIGRCGRDHRRSRERLLRRRRLVAGMEVQSARELCVAAT